MDTKTGVTLLASGTNGNCTAISSQGKTLLVDCGIAHRALKQRLMQCGIPEESLCGILLTHAHSDHIKGVETTARQYGLPVYSTEKCFDGVLEYHEKHHTGKKFSLLSRTFEAGYSFSCAQFTVSTFPVQHDVETVGYVLSTPRCKVGIATDVGHPTNLMESFLKDSHVLVLESNYDPDMLITSNRSWELKHRICGGSGHLSNRQAADLLPRIVSRNTQSVLLAHISEECNRYALAMKTARQSLADLHREDVFLTYGSREAPIPTVWC